MTHLQNPAHRRLCVSPVDWELKGGGSAENTEHQMLCSGPPLLHHHGNVGEEEMETAEEE